MVMYSVNSESVSASAANVGATTERIRSEVASMTADLLALRDSWTGSASASFAECVDQWKAVQIQVEASLESIGSQMVTASSTYADTESRNAALFAG